MESDNKPPFSKYCPTFDPREGRRIFLSVVEYGVRLSGLTRERPEDIKFYADIFLNAEQVGTFVYMMEIRKTGTIAEPERLTALGLRKNAKISSTYLDTLNMNGLSDPLWAAARIASTVNHATHCQRDLVRGGHYMGPDEPAHLCLTNAAAGPCQVAMGLAAHPFTYDTAPILPLKQCDRPDQCACRYSSRADD